MAWVRKMQAAKEWIAQKSQVVVIQHKMANIMVVTNWLSLIWMMIYHLQTKKKVANQYVVNRYGSWSAAKKISGWQMAGIKFV